MLSEASYKFIIHNSVHRVNELILSLKNNVFLSSKNEATMQKFCPKGSTWEEINVQKKTTQNKCVLIKIYENHVYFLYL